MIRKSIVIICIPLLGILIHYIKQQFKPKVLTPNELNPQYDYIIVGGGTAGCVLANRLSENDKVSVLLLEAGGQEHEVFYSHILGATPLLQGTDFDWQHITVPQDDCCQALEDRQVKWPMGKVLGGTSVLHFSHYVRPHPADFDVWDHAVRQQYENSTDGASVGWAYSNIEPYLRKLEDVRIDRLKMGVFSLQHGYSGPMVVSENVHFKTPFGQAFSEAMFSNDYQYLEDSSSAQEGFGIPQFMVNNGQRVSTASAYLRPVMHRPNLHVVARARVNKITFNFEDEMKKAVGVEYEYHGSRHRVLTNREIILSAGAVASPQLLMLSGIGPQRHMEDFNIFPLIDLPHVGQNLKDHVGFIMRYGSKNPLDNIQNKPNLFSIGSLLKNAVQYLTSGTGVLAYPPIEYAGFLKTNPMDSAPDVQFYLLHADPFAKEFGNLTTYTDEENFGSAHFAFSIGLVLLQPRSSGSVRLQSTDPSEPPLIDPRYLENDEDFNRLVFGAKILDGVLSKSPMLRQNGVHLIDTSSVRMCNEGPEAQDPLGCLVRHRLQSAYHPFGTCRMGGDRRDSVVDGAFRVHGIKGLRVVDASVIPSQITANTCATVIMLAERASDLIRSGPTV